MCRCQYIYVEIDKANVYTHEMCININKHKHKYSKSYCSKSLKT